MTIALFREKLLLDYRTPLKILAHLSLEFAVFGELAIKAIQTVYKTHSKLQ